VRVWKLPEPDTTAPFILLHSTVYHAHWLTGVALSPCEKFVISASQAGKVVIADISTGSVVRELTGIHNRYVSQVLLLRPLPQALRQGKGATFFNCSSVLFVSTELPLDATLLITAGSSPNIKYWCLETGDLLATLPDHGQSIGAIAVSHSGRTLVSLSYDCTLCFYRLDRPTTPVRMVPNQLSPFNFATLSLY